MLFEKTRKIVVIWTIGLAIKLLLLILILTKRVEIQGYQKEKLEHQGRGLAIIGNHPSLWEPFVLVFFFASFKCLFSLKHVPYVVVDKINFYDRWWFWFFRPFVVEVEREDRRKSIKSLNRVRALLEKTKIVVLFPEGGRTDNWGKVKDRGFKYSSSGNKRIARFPLGLRKLFVDLDCLVLPTWNEGGERVIPNEALPTRVVISGKTISKNRKLVMIFARFPRFWRKSKLFVGDQLEMINISEDEIVERLEDTVLCISEKGGQQ